MMALLKNHEFMIRALAAGSLFMLGMALFFEYGMGLHPCQMCIWQRIPHMIVIGLGVLAHMLSHIAILQSYRRNMIGVMGAVLLIGAGIAFWHSGVELKLLAGPASCSAGIALDGDPAALLDQILAAPIVRCDVVPWSLFGLSMANWNFLITGIIAMAALISTAIGVSTATTSRTGDH